MVMIKGSRDNNQQEEPYTMSWEGGEWVVVWEGGGANWDFQKLRE